MTHHRVHHFCRITGAVVNSSPFIISETPSTLDTVEINKLIEQKKQELMASEAAETDGQ